MNPRFLRLRRMAVASVALGGFIVLAGATYQGVATALERHRFQRPGGLVDAGGHQLHIYCVGHGSPVVILEAAMGSMSAAWGWIQPEVARSTRVCSYDRAGLGWSEAGNSRYVPSNVPEELRILLDRANEIGPIVLVGHEGGALFARMYAARFGGDTVGLVLIDDPVTVPAQNGSSLAAAWPWLARVGVLRFSGRLSNQAVGLPEAAGGAMRAFLNRPDHLTRAAMELAQLGEVEGSVRSLALPPDMIVTSVRGGASGQPAMIVSRDEASRVARAIEATVEQVRKREASHHGDKERPVP